MKTTTKKAQSAKGATVTVNKVTVTPKKAKEAKEAKIAKAKAEVIAKAKAKKEREAKALANQQAKAAKKGQYKIQVLDRNTTLKQFSKTLGGARAILLSSEGILTAKELKMLKASKKPANYKVFKANVRTYVNSSTHKTAPLFDTGKVSPFYILQSMYANEALFADFK